MSTRCQVALHYGAPEKKGKLPNDRSGSVLLYHHADGYPGFQLPKIARFLDEADARLTAIGFPYWWDPERVGAMMVALSAGTYDDPGFVGEAGFKKACDLSRPWRGGNKPYGYPMYQPSVGLHGDIEYLYDVFLLEGKENAYEVVVNAVARGRNDTPRLTEMGRYSSVAGRASKAKEIAHEIEAKVKKARG